METKFLYRIPDYHDEDEWVDIEADSPEEAAELAAEEVEVSSAEYEDSMEVWVRFTDTQGVRTLKFRVDTEQTRNYYATLLEK